MASFPPNSVTITTQITVMKFVVTAKKKVGTKSVIRNAPTEYRQPVCTEILEFPYNRLVATLIEIPATTDTFPLTTDFLKIRQSDITYYRHHTDLLPTKYRLFQKN